MSSDEDADLDFFPEGEAATHAPSIHAVPEHSKHKYNRAYEEFRKWNENNGETAVTQDAMLKYFLEMAAKNKPNTLWVYYSMLKATLRSNDNIDITSWSRLLDFLKRNHRGYKPAKAICFTENELEKFFNEAPDKQWLDLKVICIFALNGAHSCHKLVNMRIEHIKEYESYYWVLVPNAEIKQSFTITGSLFRIVKRYAALRPKTTITNRFFLQYNENECNVIPMGQNAFSKAPRKIASFLNLPKAEQYNASSFRLTTATEFLVRLSVSLFDPPDIDVPITTTSSKSNNGTDSLANFTVEPFTEDDADQSVEYSLDYETGLLKTSISHKVRSVSEASNSNDNTTEHVCTDNCSRVKCVKEDNEKNVFHAFSITKPSDYAITELIPAQYATVPSCRWIVAYSHFIDPVTTRNSDEKFDEITRKLPKNVMVLQKYVRCTSSKLFAAYVMVYGVKKCRCQKPIFGPVTKAMPQQPKDSFRKRKFDPFDEEREPKFRKRNIDPHFDPNFDPLSAVDKDDVCFSINIKQERDE